jgi:hypothetical protein
VRESYANGPLGLEQAFLLPRAPSAGRAASLTLAMRLAGNARWRIAASGRSITLSHGGSSLLYGGLLATDARGRALPASLALQAGKVLVRVDARGARYPLRIDPLVQQGQKLTGGGQESGQGEFGFSVALSSDGKTALVGAPHNNPLAGAVWVFVRSGAAWVQQGVPLNSGKEEAQKEQCEPEAEEGGDCGFGASVALSGDGNTALIGSPIAAEPCPTEPAVQCSGQGAAWVYTRSGSTWTQQGPLLTGGEEEGVSAHFGRTVALSADASTALIGAPADRSHHGSVWVFVRSGSAWVQQGTKLTVAGESGEGYVGSALAVSADGSTAVFGGAGDNAFRGGAWVFARAGSVWAQQGGKLTGGAEQIGPAHFGRGVALSGSGSLALVGGYGDNGRTGAAWAFSRSGSAWTQQGAKLTGTEEVGEPHFGRSVALTSDGAKALIGGPNDAGKQGAVWTFTRTGTTWSQSGAKLQASDSAGRSWFGYALALSAAGEAAVIGGPKDVKELGAVWAFAEGPEAEQPHEPPAEEEPPRKKKPKEPPAGPPTESPHAGAVAPAQLAAGGVGVLPFGPFASPPSCRPSLLNRHITVNSRGRTSVKLLLPGAGACRGRLTLTIKQKAPHHRTRTRTIATTAFSLAAGRVAVLALKLNTLGRALLHAGHGRLGATLAIVRLAPAPVQARTAGVRLTLQRTHASAPKKH